MRGAYVPLGWKLVPLTPTKEMLEAGTEEAITPYITAVHRAEAVYVAMLAKAPKP